MSFDNFDPVKQRIGYYEKLRQNDRDIIHFLSYYRVTYPGLGSKVFEPVDCFSRREEGNSSSNSSLRYIKDVDRYEEYDPQSRMFLAEDGLKQGEETTLHSFGWGWPA
jgi:hypothetical protein